MLVGAGEERGLRSLLSVGRLQRGDVFCQRAKVRVDVHEGAWRLTTSLTNPPLSPHVCSSLLVLFDTCFKANVKHRSRPISCVSDPGTTYSRFIITHFEK